MCFSKWFAIPEHDQDEFPEEGKKKMALVFNINNYPGTENDLRGCLNDGEDLLWKLDDEFPGFLIKRFKDSEATVKAFKTEMRNAVALLVPGDDLLVHYSGHGTYTYDESGDEADGYDEAICLYDGIVIDDDIGDILMSIPDGATVLLLFDSCFSGTVTRAFGNPNKKSIFPWRNHPTKNRFMDPKLPPRKKKRIRFTKEEMKWVVISGCGEHQTSADAYINRRYNGAFTHYALLTLTPGITYRQWHERIRKYLPSDQFDQIPMLEGKESLLDKLVLT